MPTSKRFGNLEFHRAGFGLLPDGKDKNPGTAIYLAAIPGSSGSTPWRSCTCAASKKRTCPHVRRLTKLVAEFRRAAGDRNGGDLLSSSLWYRLSELLHDGDSLACDKLHVVRIGKEETTVNVFLSPQGRELARWFERSPAAFRFLERTGKTPPAPHANRAGLLNKLALLLRTDTEQRFNQAGVKSNLQSLEDSLWGRLAYHCFREFGDGDVSFRPAIDEETGDFTLTCQSSRGAEPLFRFTVPRRQVRRILGLLAKEFPHQADLAIHPVPVKSIFKVSQTTELDLEVRPAIQALQASGETRFFEREDLEKFRYGDLVYIKELKILAELEQAGSRRKFRAPVSMTLERSQIASFLTEYRQELEEGSVVYADSLRPFKILQDYDSLEIAPAALQRSWYWLSIRYGFGNQKVSLLELLEAKREGLSYLETKEGWIDLSSASFDNLTPLLKREDLSSKKESANNKDKVRLSPIGLLRLASSAGHRVEDPGKNKITDILKRLLALEAS